MILITKIVIWWFEHWTPILKITIDEKNIKISNNVVHNKDNYNSVFSNVFVIYMQYEFGKKINFNIDQNSNCFYEFEEYCDTINLELIYDDHYEEKIEYVEYKLIKLNEPITDKNQNTYVV